MVIEIGYVIKVRDIFFDLLLLFFGDVMNYIYFWLFDDDVVI